MFRQVLKTWEDCVSPLWVNFFAFISFYNDLLLCNFRPFLYPASSPSEHHLPLSIIPLISKEPMSFSLQNEEEEKDEYLVHRFGYLFVATMEFLIICGQTDSDVIYNDNNNCLIQLTDAFMLYCPRLYTRK